MFAFINKIERIKRAHHGLTFIENLGFTFIFTPEMYSLTTDKKEPWEEYVERVEQMRTKEEYYDLVLENRRLAANPQITNCSCPNTLCDWHGKCKECVALHRHHNDHVPVCLQPIINDKIRALAGVAEMLTEKKEPTPIEYRHYVKERDKTKIDNE